LRLVITNTPDYILFRKTEVFVLRIAQSKIFGVAQMQTCCVFGTYIYHSATNF
jgi:hypothetical protein